MHFIWSAASQTPYITTVLVVDKDIDLQDYRAVFQSVVRNFRPEHDLTITPPGLADMERPASYPRGVGSRIGIDATSKWPGEGRPGALPERAQMDETITRLVENNWQAYGLEKS